MRAFARALVISAMGLIHVGMAYGKTPTALTSITCTGGSYENMNNEPVFAYTFGSGQTSTRYFTVYLNSSRFHELLLDEYIGGTFSTCYLANNNGVIASNVTIMDVTSTGVGIDVDAGSLSEDTIKQTFTEVDFSYTALSIGANTNLKPAGPVGTPEEQKRDFQAFKAKGLSLPR